MKALVILIAMLLTLYPLAELTRYIITWNSWKGNRADNLAELGVMWLWWLLMPLWLNWGIKILRRRIDGSYKRADKRTG